MKIFATIDKLERVISPESISSLKQQIHKVAEIVEISQKEPDISNNKKLLKEYPELSDDLFLGGHQCKFGVRSEIPEIGTILTKIYMIKLEDILLHYGSAISFNNSFKDNIFTIGQHHALVKIVDVFLAGYIQINDSKTPFLVQKYSQGISLTHEVLRALSITQTDFISVFRSMVTQGIVLDPFLKNWRILPSSWDKDTIVEYIDLLYWNTSEIKTQSQELLTSLSLI